MYYVQDAHSFWNWIYFIILIVIGSFFMMNLCLVVITAQFAVTKKREMERMALERKSISISLNSQNTEAGGTCWKELIRCIQKQTKQLYKGVLKICTSSRQRYRKVSEHCVIHLNDTTRHNLKCLAPLKKRDALTIELLYPIL